MTTETEVFQQLLMVHQKLGAHGADIDGLKLADRDTRAEVTRLGDRVDSTMGLVRAELKQDIERMGAAHKADTAAVLSEIKSLAKTRDDSLADAIREVAVSIAPNRSIDTIGDFIARYWKALLLVVVAIGAIVFGVGVKAGNEGLTITRIVSETVK